MAQRRKTARITALPTIQPTQKAVVPTYQALLNDKAGRLEAIRRAKEQSGFFNARYPKKLVWVRSGMGARGEIVISRDPIGSYSYGGFKMPATIDDFIIIWRRRMNYGPKEHLSRDYIEIRKLFVATWPYYPLEFNTRRTATDGIMLLDIYNIERDMIIKVFQQMNKYLNVTYDELFTILWTETVLQIAYGGNRKSIFIRLYPPLDLPLPLPGLAYALGLGGIHARQPSPLAGQMREHRLGPAALHLDFHLDRGTSAVRYYPHVVHPGSYVDTPYPERGRQGPPAALVGLLGSRHRHA